MLCQVCERFVLKKNALSWIRAGSSFSPGPVRQFLWRGELGGAFLLTVNPMLFVCAFLFLNEQGVK